jgi:dihydroorotate dehydrogenase
MGVPERVQTIEGEMLKSTAEVGLHLAAKTPLFGEAALRFARGGERIQDPRLITHLGSLSLENPLLVGAGWDKKGRVVDGLYELGFAGTEVGSVLVHPQFGNPKPRLFYKDGIGLNRLGFNAVGQERVDAYLSDQNKRGIVGISIGINKLTPHEHAVWGHRTVADKLQQHADYWVINAASPNTPNLRELLRGSYMRDIVSSVIEVDPSIDTYIKTTIDLELDRLDDVLSICDEFGVGVVDTNTTISEELKLKYGWSGEAGGLSGDIPEFRALANERMRHITKETAGTNIPRIGVGAINNTETALERIKSGAQAVQIVTAIRQHGGMVARTINQGILEQMEEDGVYNMGYYVGCEV